MANIDNFLNGVHDLRRFIHESGIDLANVRLTITTKTEHDQQRLICALKVETKLDSPLVSLGELGRIDDKWKAFSTPVDIKTDEVRPAPYRDGFLRRPLPDL